MKNKKMVLVLLPMVMVLAAAAILTAGQVPEAFTQVEKLNIERSGYVLGAALTAEQKRIAASNPLDAVTPGTFKFIDNGLNVVADLSTNRVLVLYEQFEKATQQEVRNLAGELFMSFEEPTVTAHDKVVYWAYGKDGKFSTEAFDRSKEDKKKLAVIATVKLNSEVKIMEKKEAVGPGDVYYIISSAPLLKYIQDLKS